MKKERELFCYEIGTLDWGWQYLLPISKAVLSLFNDENSDNTLQELKEDWPKAQSLAAAHGCGELRGGDQSPAVFWIPTKEFYMTYAFVFKEDNGGYTYVVSPVEMPWLEGGSFS